MTMSLFSLKKKQKAVIIITIFFLSAFCLNVYAETKAGFRAGLKGAGNSTWLLNKNIIDDPEIAYVASFGYNYGVGIGFNFIDNLGVYADVIFSDHRQGYGDDGAGTNFLETYKLKYTDFIFTLRYTAPMGFYIELGSGYGNLRSAKTSLAFYPTATNILYKDDPVNEYFSKTNLTGVLGLGSEHDIIDNLYFTAGFRLCYGLSDIISETGGKGKNYTEDSPITASNETIAYKPTNTFSGGLMLGLLYRFGN